MRQLKVFDQISKIERTVTQKAYDIIVKNKRNPRYKLLAYVGEDGTPLDMPLEPEQVLPLEKKVETELKSAEPVVNKITLVRSKEFFDAVDKVANEKQIVTETPAEGVTVIRKSKQKTNAKK